jgi:hypothetical protein
MYSLAYGSTCWILARSAGHRCSGQISSQSLQKKSEARVAPWYVPCVFLASSHCACQTAGICTGGTLVEAEKGSRALQSCKTGPSDVAVAVGARPRFVQLASDDSQSRIVRYFPCASKSPSDMATFCLCLPQIPGPCPNLLREDSWSTHPGLALNRFASATVLVFGIVSACFASRHLHTINHSLTGQRRETTHAILLAS